MNGTPCNALLETNVSVANVYLSHKPESRAFHLSFDSDAQLSYVSPKVKVFLNLEIRAKKNIFFDFFRYYPCIFQVEAILLYSKSVFFNILYPASVNEFSANGNSIFLVRAILLLLEVISVINK